jgi:probable phosphoglycerate mutase
MPSPSTQFTFIRHGETDWNRQHRFQGQIDVPLNATGHEQAARLARRLAPDAAADVLLSSDLERARQTAEPLARAWGLPVRDEPGLREQAFGVLEGLDFPTIQREHPQLLAQWARHRADFALPGGESQGAFHARVSAAVQALCLRYAGLHVVVVTHGGVLDMLWRSAHQQPLDGPRRCDIPNTGLNRLRWRAGALVIEHWADDAHLAGMTA